MNVMEILRISWVRHPIDAAAHVLLRMFAAVLIMLCSLPCKAQMELRQLVNPQIWDAVMFADSTIINSGFKHTQYSTISLINRDKETYVYADVRMADDKDYEEALRRVSENICSTLDDVAQSSFEAYSFGSHTESADSVDIVINVNNDDSRHETVNAYIHFQYLSYGKRVDSYNLGISYKKTLARHDEDAVDLNIDAYLAAMSPILNVPGVAMRQVHYRHQDYKPEPDERFAYYLYEEEADTVNGEAFGLHYIIDDESLARSVLNAVQQASIRYVMEHPCEQCSVSYIHRNMIDVVHHTPFRVFNPVMSALTQSGKTQFTLYATYASGRYHLLFLNSEGYLWIPAEWEHIKDYDNGKKEYYE